MGRKGANAEQAWDTSRRISRELLRRVVGMRFMFFIFAILLAPLLLVMHDRETTWPQRALSSSELF